MISMPAISAPQPSGVDSYGMVGNEQEQESTGAVINRNGHEKGTAVII